MCNWPEGAWIAFWIGVPLSVAIVLVAIIICFVVWKVMKLDNKKGKNW